MRTLDLTGARPIGSREAEAIARIEIRSCGVSAAWTSRFTDALRRCLKGRERILDIHHEGLEPAASPWMSVAGFDPDGVSVFVEVRWGSVLEKTRRRHVLLIDGAEAARFATAELHHLGHTAIAFLAGPPADPMLVDLADGHVRALAALCLPFDHELILVGEATRGAGHEAIRRLVASGRRFTAVLASTAAAAAGAVDALSELQVDASVLSLEENDSVSWCAVAVDTVAEAVTRMLEVDPRATRDAAPDLLPPTLRELVTLGAPRT